MVQNTISLQRPVEYYYDITQKEKSIINNFCIELPKNTYTTIGINNYDLQDTLKRINQLFHNKNTNTTSIGEIVQQKYIKKLDKIQYNNHTYEFNFNFIYMIYLCDGIFVAENEYFNLIGYGDTIKEAEEDMYSTLEDLWNIYVLEDDKNLDNGAKQLKQKLQKNIIRKE